MDGLVVGDAVLEGRRLTGRVTVPRWLGKYFRSREFFAIYDEDIHADPSILNIPLVATVLPLAWLAGVDVHVNTLDKTFKESMDQLQQVFQKDHPEAHFKTRITTNRLVDNQIGVLDPSERTALLFSGGVDSTHTLLTHLNLNPRLVMLWGVDHYPYPENSTQWRTIISTYTRFAERMGLKFNVVKTNNSGMLEDQRISHDYHQCLYDGWFRLVLQHTFILIPLTAPLSMGRFDRLLISGGSPRSPDDRRHPHPSRPETDEKFIWADLKVEHVRDIYREEKISGAIRQYLQNDGLKLKVCLRKLERPQLNDSTCVKCLRTIANLALAGIDGNECGFQVDKNTWTRLRDYLENDLERETFGSGRSFRRLQKRLPDRVEDDFYGSREFFEWFRHFDLRSKEKDVWFYRDLYHSLPYPAARVLDVLYSVMGVRIHDNMPQPRKDAQSQAA